MYANFGNAIKIKQAAFIYSEFSHFPVIRTMLPQVVDGTEIQAVHSASAVTFGVKAKKMLDFFSVFGKGGIVLWCFQGTSQIFTSSVNALIKDVILQEQGQSYDYEDLTLKYKLDNQFELVYVVAYQKTLQLSYVDKFLENVQLEFRDVYKNQLQLEQWGAIFDFGDTFIKVLKSAEEWDKKQAAARKKMKTFEESQKSKKTVASMIERKGDNEEKNKKPVKKVEIIAPEPEPVVEMQENMTREEMIQMNLHKRAEKSKKNVTKSTKEKTKFLEVVAKKTKESRVWKLGGAVKDLETLDYTKGKEKGDSVLPNAAYLLDAGVVGTLKGQVRDMEVSEDEEEDDIQENITEQAKTKKKSGLFSLFK